MSPDELGLTLAALTNGLAIELAFYAGVVPTDFLARLFTGCPLADRQLRPLFRHIPRHQRGI
jgi:hypothetical protein